MSDKNKPTETRTQETKSVKKPSRLKRCGGLRFLGWSTASFWVGRPFLSHETCLVQASSDSVAGCAKARVEPSVPRRGTDVPRHQVRYQRVLDIKKLEQASNGCYALRCHCQLNKDDINLVLAYSRGEARCLKRHTEEKGAACSSGLRTANSPALCPCEEPHTILMTSREINRKVEVPNDWKRRLDFVTSMGTDRSGL